MAVSTWAALEMKRLIRTDYLLDSHHATQKRSASDRANAFRFVPQSRRKAFQSSLDTISRGNGLLGGAARS
jgi:hypothetical protein